MGRWPAPALTGVPPHGSEAPPNGEAKWLVRRPPEPGQLHSADPQITHGESGGEVVPLCSDAVEPKSVLGGNHQTGALPGQEFRRPDLAVT